MTMKAFQLGDELLTAETLVRLAKSPGPNVAVSESAWKRLVGYREIVERAVAENRRIYGINTGFGFLADVQIDTTKLAQLQLNLVRSHACGVGEPVELKHTRALLILRAHAFLLGHSGVSRAVVETVLGFLRCDILPVIPCQGSVGASGDLAPLSHLALGLIGEGEVFYKGQKITAKEALQDAGMKPLSLGAKEGLALINGTQFMTVLGAFAVTEAETLARSADIIAALSLDAIKGTLQAFDLRIHALRKQPGQMLVAQNFQSLFGSTGGKDEIMESHRDCGKVQDPYSFRCVPQVHGASRDAIDYVRKVIDIELNSVTDNPLVFDDGSVISGGNFHGQPVAMALDFLGIAAAEIASISERRTEKLTNPALSGLPAFITKDSGLNSGFMIPHVVAAALVSENKILAHPACVDSIPTSADKEDHVSMGPIAARKALRIIKHSFTVLGIESLAAAQAIDLHKPLKAAQPLQFFYNGIRHLSKAMDVDRSLHKDIEAVTNWLVDGGGIVATGLELN